MPSRILCLFLLESSDFKCLRFFCEGTNAIINLILKVKTRFSPIPLTPLPVSMPEEVTTNTAKLKINL